jgi:hypothetical protein
MKAALLSLLVLASAAASASGQRVTLVRNGKSTYAIVLGPGATSATRHGAEDLQRFLKEMSGADLPILDSDSGAPRDVVRIETAPQLAEEELRIRTDGTTVRISGGGKRGAMYGCYALLEDVLGCRWYNTRESRIPKRKTVVVGPLDIHQKPAFE